MAASYTALAPPLHGEDMDISSPGQIDFDDDILLDDGDHRIEQQSLDERMQEGDDRPTTANDEEMSDDAQHAEVREEVMGDDAVVGEDEDLIDYSDVEDDTQELLPEQDEPVNDAPPPQQDPDPISTQGPGSPVVGEALAHTVGSHPVENELPQPVADAEADEQVDEEIERDPEAAQPHVEIATQTELPDETIPVEAKPSEQPSQHDEVDPVDFTLNPSSPKQRDEHPDVENTGDVVDGVNESTPQATFPEGGERDQDQGYDERNDDQAGHKDEEHEASDELKQPPAPVSTDHLQPAPEAPGTPTDTGLHPMILNYGEFEIPLFKSRHQPDGLLKDDNLASVSLAELMQNCRHRLASKLGEEISEDQELILRFDSLACNLVENARPAFETSLNDVLDIFLQLHQNDGVDDVPPFQLTLTHQLKFSSSLSAFKTAAAGGQGMSTFTYLYENLGEDYEADGEQFEEQYYEDPTRQDDTDANNEHQNEDEDHNYQVGDEYTEDQSGNAEDFQEYDNNASQEGYEASYNEHQLEQDQSLLSADQDPAQQQAQEQQPPADETLSQHQQEGDGNHPSSDGNIPGNDNLEYDSHEQYQHYNNGEFWNDEINWDLDEPLLTELGSDLAADQQEDATNFTGHGDTTTVASIQEPDENTTDTHQEPSLTGEDDDDIDFTFKNVESSDPPNNQYGNVPEDVTGSKSDDEFANSNEENEQQLVEQEDGPQHEPSDAADGDGAEPAAETPRLDTPDLPTSIPLVDDEDTIDFDDDTQEEHARKESQAQAHTHLTGAGSPNGKRSFDEHVEDEIDLSSPDAKKARSR